MLQKEFFLPYLLPIILNNHPLANVKKLGNKFQFNKRLLPKKYNASNARGLQPMMAGITVDKMMVRSNL